MLYKCFAVLLLNGYNLPVINPAAAQADKVCCFIRGQYFFINAATFMTQILH